MKAVAWAREALQVLEAERHDALVSDIDLSDEDRYALIRSVISRRSRAAVRSYLEHLKRQVERTAPF